MYRIERDKNFKRIFLVRMAPFYSCVLFIEILLKVNYILEPNFVPVICIASRM